MYNFFPEFVMQKFWLLMLANLFVLNRIRLEIFGDFGVRNSAVVWQFSSKFVEFWVQKGHFLIIPQCSNQAFFGQYLHFCEKIINWCFNNFYFGHKFALLNIHDEHTIRCYYNAKFVISFSSNVKIKFHSFIHTYTMRNCLIT